MTRITNTQKIKRLGTIMAVWAHPDDEAFLAAGLLAAAAQNEQTVVCVTATQGGAGTPDPEAWPLAKLATKRAKEMAAGLRILGIEYHHWLGYEDGHCSEVDSRDAVKQLLPLVQRYRPNTFITFGPDGWTGHPDHQAVSAWTTELLKHLSYQIEIFHVVSEVENYQRYLRSADKILNIFFKIDEPPLRRPEECDIYLELPDELMKLKYAALKAHLSQTAALFENFDDDFINAAFAIEAFVKASSN